MQLDDARPPAGTPPLGVPAREAHAHTFKSSPVYRELVEERSEIDRLKWIESEKAGHDIGADRALHLWVRQHRDGWRLAHRGKDLPSPQVG